MNAVDSNGHTPLFRACERGHTEVVVVLLHASASVELSDTSGRRCLHWAASGGHSAICSSLIHQGLPADTPDSGGWVLIGALYIRPLTFHFPCVRFSDEQHCTVQLMEGLVSV